MARKEIYLDGAATTPLKKEVLKEMEFYMLEEFGNPSSMHEKGEKAQKALQLARKKFALELNCKAQEIYFTSGATESNNLAIQGLARSFPQKKKVLVSEIEHPSLIEPCEFLAKQGYEIVKIPANKAGIVDLEFIKNKLKEYSSSILLVSVMHVNNIIGTIQPVREIGKLCRANRILFHTDAAQSFGKLKINVPDCSIDLLSASAHKLGGPKGIGFLYVRNGVKITPLLFGGDQEKGLRSGTENVPGIAGFAKALELQKKVNKEKIKKLRDKLFEEIEKIGGKIQGSKEKRIYNTVNAIFKDINPEDLILFLSAKKIYVSSGSACESRKENNNKVFENGIRITLDENFSENKIKILINEIKNFLKEKF